MMRPITFLIRLYIRVLEKSSTLFNIKKSLQLQQKHDTMKKVYKD